MFHRLALPPLNTVKYFEGKGNYAVMKYYRFPFSFFYRHKLKMVVKMMERGKIYRNILDFGAGEPQIFNKELRRHAMHVHCADTKEDINVTTKYDLIVCASVLEFVWLKTTLPVLKIVLKPHGTMIVASPMSTWFTHLYFKVIKDRAERHSHQEILSELTKYFNVVDFKSWLGLYFCCKVAPK